MSGRSLVARYDLSTDNPPDLCYRGNRYPGTGANIVGHPDGIAGGRCMELNGNNSYVTCGDIVELNAVSAFTIAFWMNQKVLDVADRILYRLNGTTYLLILTEAGGDMGLFMRSGGIENKGSFDYSTVISASSWHHVAWVFDGSQTGAANRLMCFVDGAPVTLGFVGAIPATSPDLAGVDLTIGRATNSFDGKLDEFMIFSSPLTHSQAADCYTRSRKGIWP